MGMMSVLGATRCPRSEVNDLAGAKELFLLVMGQVLSCFNVIFSLATEISGSSGAKTAITGDKF